MTTATDNDSQKMAAPGGLGPPPRWALWIGPGWRKGHYFDKGPFQEGQPGLNRFEARHHERLEFSP